jgi:hypothetical protein
MIPALAYIVAQIYIILGVSRMDPSETRRRVKSEVGDVRAHADLADLCDDDRMRGDVAHHRQAPATSIIKLELLACSCPSPLTTSTLDVGRWTFDAAQRRRGSPPRLPHYAILTISYAA